MYWSRSAIYRLSTHATTVFEYIRHTGEKASNPGGSYATSVYDVAFGSGSAGSWWLRAYSVNGYSDEASRLTCYAGTNGNISWTNAIHTQRVAFGSSNMPESGSAKAWFTRSHDSKYDGYNKDGHMTRVEPSGVSWFSFADTNYAVAFGFRRNVWLRFGI